ncbi:MAG TPA: FAD:protein FMN transferase [Patescibacteria group bacterium]|jgi:thiamine biosynthesis lipoprotein|nr:FAD:protein FMN transferase [Patescibacteria group bacterium]
MKQTKIIMGMPITVEIVDDSRARVIDDVFNYFVNVDKKFSTYKPASEITKINHGLPADQWSKEMRQVMDLCEQTKKLSNGYFDIVHNGKIDPSGLVKGWAINNAAKLLLDKGVADFYIEAGGDIQVHGTNADKAQWVIGIRSPFNLKEIIKVITLNGKGIATSGTYIRGQHIYNPHNRSSRVDGVKSLSVIGSNVYEADRYATAAFAMGKNGIAFIESVAGLEGYMVDSNKIATYTSGFNRYVVNNA